MLAVLLVEGERERRRDWEEVLRRVGGMVMLRWGSWDGDVVMGELEASLGWNEMGCSVDVS